MKKVFCYHCKKQIDSNDDLVTSLYVFFLRPYHSSCYSLVLRSTDNLLLHIPINSVLGNLSAIMGPIFGLLMLVFIDELGDIPVALILALAFLAMFFSPSIRIYSYFKFERILKYKKI